MKRDMDLVREILKDLSEANGPLDASAFVTDARGRELVGYHFRIMSEAGLIVATIMSGDNDPYYVCRAVRLTWEGEDFLAAVASDTVWGKVKKAVAKAVGDASLETFKAVAVDFARKAILQGRGCASTAP